MRLFLAMILAILALLVVTQVSTAGDGTCDGTQIHQRDRDCQCDCDEPCDVDGDGICDNCGGHLPVGPDADGDGVPNGQDDDYVPPEDGTGQQKGR
ncbi:MAG: hypothetical protein IT445_04995 [Phycisphaeraceae bacterium]|nr:hypothetical protein [Phycisphaeraceae bacterium]